MDKNLIVAALMLLSSVALAQPVRTTITDDGTNVTVQTPVNIKVIPICDFHWVFVDGQLKMWIEGGNELIPGGRLGNFTINGATTQASKLAALGAISAQCGGGGSGSQIDSAYLSGDTLVLVMSPSDIATPGVGNIFSTSGVAKGAKIWSLGSHMQQWSSTSYPYALYFGEQGYGFGTNDLSNSRFHFLENNATLRSVRFGNSNTAGGEEIRAYAGATTSYVRMAFLGSTYATSGLAVPNMGLLEATRSGGLKIGASDAAGDLIFFAGGLGGADQFGILTDAGDWGWGTITPDRPFEWERSSTATNSIQWRRETEKTTGTAAAGFGLGYETYLEDASGNDQIAATEAIYWETATNGSEKAVYQLGLTKSGVVDTVITIDGDGNIWPEGGYKDSSGDLGTTGQVLRPISGGTNWTNESTYQAFTTTATFSPVNGGFYTVNGNSGAWTATMNVSGLNAGDSFTIKGYQVSSNNVTLDASSGGFIDVDADIASPQATFTYNATSSYSFYWDGTNLHVN